MSQLPPGERPHPLTIHAADGYALVATRYPAIGAERARLIVAGATGVPQGFYRRFAEYASARGYTVLTFDFRGVGQSAPPSLRGFDANFLDWSRLDLRAVVESFGAGAGQSDDVPLFMVGHSYGGHALGLLPNHERIDGMYMFGVGAGWHGWMPRRERPRVWLMWSVFGPLITRWKGRLAWSMLGMGEDLPLGVYKQWKRWCNFPRYFFDDPTVPEIAEGFAQVRTPIMALNATDDLWAPPRSRDAFMSGYRHAPWYGIDIDPAVRGFGKLGHMGYFRQHAEPLWAGALDWFEGLGQHS
jgi:predicted alpha/beta hydrolase